MALVPAECSACGGLVKVDNEERLAICQYCGKPFVVEEAIQTFNNYYNNIYNITHNTNHNYGDGAVVNVYEDKSKDFVIEGGVLKKYQGESLTPVVPEGVVAIEPKVFSGSTITKVTLPSTLKEMRYSYIVHGSGHYSGSFYDCKYLNEIVFTEGIKYIGNGAFHNCTDLTSIVIPDSVTSIGDEAFCRCINLKSITFPDTLTSIGKAAFKDCTSLDFSTIPEGVSIAAEAFYGCKSLTDITIPKGVRISGRDTLDGVIRQYGAFENCTNLTSVKKLDSCTYITSSAFENTPYGKNENAKWQAKKNKEIFEWRSKGLCEHCGGEFKGFLKKECTRCGRSKNYK